MTTEAKPKAGLEDVVAASSAICYLDGDRGVLAYCGYDIHDLAQRRDVRGGLLPAVARPAAEPRRARRPAVAARGRAAAGRAHPAPHEAAAAVRRHGRAAHADLDLGHYDPEAADNSPQANYRKAVRLTAQLASLVATYGRLQAGGGPIEPDPALGHAANFLYMLTGDAAERALDAGVRHRARAARRSRAERLDVRGARRGRDADRHALGDRRRHRRAEGAAARRRERRRHAAAHRDRPGRAARAHRRRDPRRSWRARRRFRASATASIAPRIRAPRTCGACRRSSASAPATRAGSRCPQRIEAARQGREEAVPERRLLLGVDLLHARHPDRSVHADLRREPRSPAGRRTASSSTRTTG